MAISDLRSYTVSNWLQLLLIVAVVMTDIPRGWNVMLALSIYCSYKLFYKYVNKWIGGADIKIFCILTLYNFTYALAGFYIATGLGLIYALVKNKKRIPFVPFIWIGYMLVNI